MWQWQQQLKHEWLSRQSTWHGSSLIRGPVEACNPQGERARHVKSSHKETCGRMACSRKQGHGPTRMTKLTSYGQLILVAFGAHRLVTFGAGNGWQLEAAIDRLQSESPRLTQRAWGEGRKVDHHGTSSGCKTIS